MTRIERIGIDGIYPAIVCPLSDDLQVDEAALAAHISSLDQVAGIKGFLVNGHAGENLTLARVEKCNVMKVARTSVSDDTLLICGVNSESTVQAQVDAQDAQSADADAIMIFPPSSWATAATQDMIVAHHKAIIEATELPIFLYQAPISMGPMAYSHDVIEALISLPRVIGIKEGSWEVATYEANRRLVKSAMPSISVMASGDEHLLTSFILGSEGSIVSLAIIIPEVIVCLDEAVRRGDLAGALEAHEIIYPLAKAIYGSPPANLATARLKTCLRLLGRLECDAMRLPIPPLSDHEVDRLRNVLLETGLLPNDSAMAANG